MHTKRGELIVSVFTPVSAPSQNRRYGVSGKRKGKRVYLNEEHRYYQEEVIGALAMTLSDPKMKKGEFYCIDLFMLDDWYSFEELLRAGAEVDKSVGNMGDNKQDLDNLPKAPLDAIKKYLKNDDRFATELRTIKVQWPQKKGTLIQIYRGAYYEAGDLEGMVPKETLSKIVDNG